MIELIIMIQELSETFGEFKQKTFSGYKKSDVIQNFQKVD